LLIRALSFWVHSQREFFTAPTIVILNRMDFRVRWDKTLPKPVSHIVEVPAAVSHVAGWKHFEDFLNNPELYNARQELELKGSGPVNTNTTNPNQKQNTTTSTQAASAFGTVSSNNPDFKPETRLSQLLQNGERIIRRLHQRIAWYWQLKCESPTYREQLLYDNPLFIELCCKLIAAVRSHTHIRTNLIESNAMNASSRVWLCRIERGKPMQLSS
jgi:hypothetical protein